MTKPFKAELKDILEMLDNTESLRHPDVEWSALRALIKALIAREA